jgi:hypothetical protein
VPWAPGFIEARGILFPQKTPNDSTQAVSDWLWRQEAIARPASWLQLVGGMDLRLNTHDQVDDVVRVDWEDRGLRAPLLSVRRLAANVTAGRFTLNIGKQLIRWARADVLNPIDRFAPRDFTNVIDAEFLPVIAARASVQMGPETVEVVWVPQLTPSRMPLLTQRWTVVPPESATVSILDRGSRFSTRAQQGVRWRHTGSLFGTGLSYVDGFNHFPTLEVRPLDPEGTAVALTRVFPRIRSYGADFVIPTRWITFKAEGALFTSPEETFDDYGLYVAELERQIGEWLVTAGYAGETGSGEHASQAFDPERSLARSIVARVSYTVDPRRTITIEAVGRQSGDGYYLKGEYSQAVGDLWRLTLKQIVLAGQEGDFLGQFDRNSHFVAALRLTF